MRNLEQHIVVGQVGYGGHVLGQLVSQGIQAADDVAAFTDVEPHQVFIQFFVELIGVFALAWNSSVAAGTRLIGEYHSAERSVEEFVLVELARGKRGA